MFRVRLCVDIKTYKNVKNLKTFFKNLRFSPALPLSQGLAPRIPVLKVTNYRSGFGKIPKIPVLELVANKIYDTFLDYRLFVTAYLA